MHSLHFCVLVGVGNGDGRDLIVQFVRKGEVVFEARFGTDTNCTVSLAVKNDGNVLLARHSN